MFAFYLLMCTFLIGEYVWAEKSSGGFNDVTLRSGEMLRLECKLKDSVSCQPMKWAKVTQGSVIIYSWDFYCKYSTKNTRYKFYFEPQRSTYVMEIRNVKPEDSGSYSCFFEDDVTLQSNPRSISVIDNWPQPSCTIRPLNPKIGTPVEFICSLPPESPTVPLRWTKTMPLDFGGTMAVGSNGSYSVMWTLWETDAYEKFTCYVGNGVGRKSCSVQPLDTELKVLPAITRNNKGDNAIFECSIPPSDIPMTPLSSRTFPDYEYTWVIQIKNRRETRQEIKMSTSDKRYVLMNGGQTLQILNLNEKDNKLLVRCKVRLQNGERVGAKGAAILFVNTEHRTVKSDIISRLPGLHFGKQISEDSEIPPGKPMTMDKNVTILLVMFACAVILFLVGILLTEIAGRRIRQSLAAYTEEMENRRQDGPGEPTRESCLKDSCKDSFSESSKQEPPSFNSIQIIENIESSSVSSSNPATLIPCALNKAHSRNASSATTLEKETTPSFSPNDHDEDTIFPGSYASNSTNMHYGQPDIHVDEQSEQLTIAKFPPLTISTSVGTDTKPEAVRKEMTNKISACPPPDNEQKCDFDADIGPERSCLQPTALSFHNLLIHRVKNALYNRINHKPDDMFENNRSVTAT